MSDGRSGSKYVMDYWCASVCSQQEVLHNDSFLYHEKRSHFISSQFKKLKIFDLKINAYLCTMYEYMATKTFMFVILYSFM